MANDFEKRLDRAFEDITPDVLDSVLLHLDARDKNGATPPDNITALPKKTHTRPAAWRRWAVGAAAALALTFGGYFTYGNLLVDSTINFDVNPSIQLTLNRNEKILSATPLNEDATLILDNMNLKHVDLDVAVNALIGSMLKHGYLTEIANSILVSVEHNDAAHAAALQERLNTSIYDLLSAYALDGSVLSQSYTGKDSAIASLATAHNISYGKAELVDKLVALDPTLQFSDIAPLPVNDINLLLSSAQAGAEVAIDGVTSTGSASSAAYIGMDAACSIALDHAGLTAAQTTVTEAKLDYDNGQMVYELEFRTSSAEYECEIDATTGAVLDFEADPFDGPDASTSATPAHNGQSDKSGTVPPQAGSHEAPYVRNDDDSDDDDIAVPASHNIGVEQALSIALQHAGLTPSEVTVTELELDDDDDGDVYDIRFTSGNAEYKYEVDAATGGILKTKSQIDDD